MRKLRTRQHIIEDLGFNHVERQVLLAGYVLRRYPQPNYVYDGAIDTFNEQGEVENLSIMLKLKSIDNEQVLNQKNEFAFDLIKSDLELWLSGNQVVILIFFEAHSKTTYFVDLETYFQKNKTALKKVRKFVKIYFSKESIFDVNAIKKLKKRLN